MEQRGGRSEQIRNHPAGSQLTPVLAKTDFTELFQAGFVSHTQHDESGEELCLTVCSGG